MAVELLLWLCTPLQFSVAGENQPGDDKIEVIHVRGVRLGMLPRDATSFSSDIDLAHFEGEQRRLEDLLAQTVGVQLRRFGGPGERAEISIRGFAASQVVVKLDGMSLNSGQDSGVDLASIPLAQLASVSVVRGGSSLRAGSGAMGGVVELRSRRPDFPSQLVSAKAGSFGTYDVSFYRTQPGEKVDLGFGYSGFTTQGDFKFSRLQTRFSNGSISKPSPPTAVRINNKHERHNGYFSVGRDLDTAGYLLAQQSLSYASQGEPGLEREVPSNIAGQQRFAHKRALRSLSQLRWEDIELGIDAATLEASISHRMQKSQFRDKQPALLAPLDDRFDDSTTAFSLRPAWSSTGWAGDHQLHGELLVTRDAAHASGDKLRTRLGVAGVLRDEARFFDRHLLIEPGLRMDWTDLSGSHLIPSLGIVVSPAPWLQFKGNLNRSFRNPSFQDLFLPDRGFISGNPNLEPERATNYDLGFALSLDSFFIFRNLKASASVFRSKIADSIIWIPVSPFKVRPENSGPSRSQGVEISSSLELGAYLTVSANHTELRATTKAGGVRLPGRAKRETHLRLALGRAGVVKLVAEMQRTGSISLSRGGSFLLAPRTSWNASLAFELSHLLKRFGFDLTLRRFWLHAAVDNLSNIAIRDSLSFPQPGRSVRMGVEATW